MDPRSGSDQVAWFIAEREQTYGVGRNVGAPPGAPFTMPTQLYGSDEQHSKDNWRPLLKGRQ